MTDQISGSGRVYKKQTVIDAIERLKKTPGHLVFRWAYENESWIEIKRPILTVGQLTSDGKQNSNEISHYIHDIELVNQSVVVSYSFADTDQGKIAEQMLNDGNACLRIFAWMPKKCIQEGGDVDYMDIESINILPADVAPPLVLRNNEQQSMDKVV